MPTKEVLMLQKYFKFIGAKSPHSFREATDEEMDKLKELAGRELPEDFVELFRHAMPTEEVEVSDITFYPLERIIAENTEYVPGRNVSPYGMFAFASTEEGDPVCVDLVHENHTVFHCPHELLGDGKEISFCKDEMITLPFNYDTVTDFSGCIGEDLDEFLEMLITRTIELYTVTEIIDLNYRDALKEYPHQANKGKE